ncbi:MAG: hypothetical protein AAFR81_08110 [Chloroflexota bacterium]
MLVHVNAPALSWLMISIVSAVQIASAFLLKTDDQQLKTITKNHINGHITHTPPPKSAILNPDRTLPTNYRPSPQ